MNKDILAGKWKQLKGEIKTQWNKLTDDDLGQIEGNQDKFLGALQEKYGYAKDKAQAELDSFLNKHEDKKSCNENDRAN